MNVRELATRFNSLFAGLERGYGTYNNINIRCENGKMKGEPKTERKPVTLELWEGHLSGENGIGIIPIRDDSTCVFGAIDVDVYTDIDHGRIAANVARKGIPLIVCRSKSGGAHLFLFSKEPVLAGTMQAKLRELGSLLGFGTAEIFPKQTKLTPGSHDLGSWINIPYAQAHDTNRYAITPNGEAMTAEEFLDIAEIAKVGPDFFERSGTAAKKTGAEKKDQPLPDGPPCLQNLMEIGFPEGTRNGSLFNLGIYFRKANPIDWIERLEAANAHQFTPPLMPTEVSTIVYSLKRKDYQYQCSANPLAAHCNSVVCRTRKYGVGGGANSFPTLGQMRVLRSTPPVWYLDITNDKDEVVVLELTTQAVQDQRLFQRACMEQLKMVPVMPSNVIWTQMIQKLVASATDIAPLPSDATAEGQLWEYLESFCTGRMQAQRIEEITAGKPFTDVNKKRTYFRLSDFRAFLKKKGFAEYQTVQELARALRERKLPEDKKKPLDEQRSVAEHRGEHVAKGKFVNLWSVPMFQADLEEFTVPDDLLDKF